MSTIKKCIAGFCILLQMRHTTTSSTPTQFKPAVADLILSAGMALGFPLLAGLLWNVSGALVPMLLYYAAA